jgi:hypothetical protein
MTENASDVPKRSIFNVQKRYLRCDSEAVHDARDFVFVRSASIII